MQISTRPVEPITATLGLMCGDGYFGILAEGDSKIANLPVYDWIVQTIRSVTESNFASDQIVERLSSALSEFPEVQICITFAGFRRHEQITQRTVTRISNLEPHDQGRLSVFTFVKPPEDSCVVLVCGMGASLTERQKTALNFIEKRPDILQDFDSLISIDFRAVLSQKIMNTSTYQLELFIGWLRLRLSSCWSENYNIRYALEHYKTHLRHGLNDL